MNEFIQVEKMEPWRYIIDTDINNIYIKKGALINDYLKQQLLRNGIYLIPVIKNRVYDYSSIDNETINKTFDVLKTKLKNLEETSIMDKRVISEISEEITEKINYDFQDFLYLPLKKFIKFDEYTYTHSLNVGIIAGIIGKSLRLEKEKITKLIKSGILHDIGKSRVDINILNAPRKLLEEEFEVMKKHSIYGKDILEENDINDEDIINGCYYHHERINGSGYPEGLKGEEIPLFGKIIAVSDNFDALTSKRSYKDVWNNYKVVSYLVQNSSILFDRKIIENFVNIFGIYPPGTKVILNNNRKGTVVASNKNNHLQPLVQCDNDIIDTNKDNLFIKEIIDEGV